GQREGLLLGHRVGLVGGVVLDIATRGLAAQPFGDVARVRLRGRGQFLGRGGRGGQGLVQAEVVADDHAARRRCRAQVPDELAQELVELVAVDCHDETPLGARYAITAQTAPGGCNGVTTRLQRASLERGKRARRGTCGRDIRTVRASSSGTASRWPTRCSARVSPPSSSPRPIRWSTPGPGRPRCRTWPGRLGSSPSTREGTGARTGRSRPPPTPTPSSWPTPSRSWTPLASTARSSSGSAAARGRRSWPRPCTRTGCLAL